ncbi:MAG: COP23 domain-containing protein [Cyanobacteria bacterium J06623_7]
MNLNQHFPQSWGQGFKACVSFATIPGAMALFSLPASVSALELKDFHSSNIQQLRRVLSQRDNPPEVIIHEPGASSPSRTAQNSDTRFNCELIDGEYTVMYYPESQPDRGYAWAIPTELGGGWTPQRRCDAIVSRFEQYRQDGLLELTTGSENGYDTICVTTQLDPTDCRIVLTVPPGQDPQLTRDLIFDNLLVADDGGSTQGVYTFGDSQAGNRDILGEIGNVLGGNSSSLSRKSSPESINLKPFLDPADGGTGENLRGNSVAPSSPSGNSERKPDLFK